MTAAQSRRRPARLLATLVLGLSMAAGLLHTGALQAQAPTPPQKDAILLTVFLRHDQTKTLDEIQAQLRKNGFYQKFPPPGVEVVSWYVMMGIGQAVTLRVPPEKLREVNLALEHSAWGAFRTEFYPTYDYRPIWAEEMKRAPEGRKPAP